MQIAAKSGHVRAANIEERLNLICIIVRLLLCGQSWRKESAGGACRASLLRELAKSRCEGPPHAAGTWSRTQATNMSDTARSQVATIDIRISIAPVAGPHIYNDDFFCQELSRECPRTMKGFLRDNMWDAEQELRRFATQSSTVGPRRIPSMTLL